MPSTPLSGTESVIPVEPELPSGEGPEAESPPQPLVLAGLEASLGTVDLDELESLARIVTGRWVEDQFRALPGTEEVALLGTCCRRELLLLLRSEEEIDAWRRRLPGRTGGWTLRLGREVTHHLFRVASGLESIVAGEKEVRAQIRAASPSTISRHHRRVIRDLLMDAVATADRLAPRVPASRSIAAVAATRVLELVGHPFPRVLVIGGGAVGRQVTELLGPSARVTVAYRRQPPDAAFLRAAGARAVRAEGLAAEIALSDAVVTAAKSGERCLGPSDLPRSRPIVMIDLGVPRNVDPAVRALSNVRLVDLGELRPVAPPEEEAGFEQAVADSADRSFARLERLALEPWISAARRHVEELRVAELALAREFLGELTAEQAAAVERLSRRLVDRLLLGPTVRLREIPPGEEGDRLRRFALELLRPAPSGP